MSVNLTELDQIRQQVREKCLNIALKKRKSDNRLYAGHQDGFDNVSELIMDAQAIEVFLLEIILDAQSGDKEAVEL